MISKNQKGLSLVSVMVAIGLLGAVSLGVMRLMEQISSGQATAQNSADEAELRILVHQILNDESSCRVSLAGNGTKGSPVSPVVFNKNMIDENTPGEGLDVELYFANQAGDARTLKKLSGTDTSANTFGKISINSIKLVMNNPTLPPGGDYAQSSGHSDVGEVVITLNKKVYKSDRQVVHRFPVLIGMQTNSSGASTIISCSREYLDSPEFTYPQNCNMTFSHSDNGGAYRSVVLGMNKGGFVGLRLRGDVNSDDRFRISGNCGNGDEMSAYFRACQIGFGWRDSTDRSNPIDAAPSTAHNQAFNSTITLQTGGDVNADDSFYYRIRCPNGSNPDLNEYVKKKCLICMGHTDLYYHSPEKASCRYIQDSFDNSWGRIMTSGDVGHDDAMFLGFFCEGEYAPIIKNWSY